MRLSADIDRAERIGTATPGASCPQGHDPRSQGSHRGGVRKVHELGTKLFYQTAIGPGYPDATPDDYPAVIVRRMEESAEGCRWLLEQWAQLLNVVDAKVPWGDPEVIRFCGLLGKRGIEAHFDPELNALFHAFDAIAKGLGQRFWTERRDHIPLGYYGGFQFVNYRIITAPPRDKNEAMVLICTVIAKNVGRLEKLLKEYEAIEAEEADERYDRAALDCSRAFERHRRYQSARTRELLRMLEEFRRMREEEGQRKKEKGKMGMPDDKCQMADSEVEATGLVVDLVVGQDPNLVLEESTNDKSGILSHEEMDTTDRSGQAAGNDQGVTNDGASPKKAQNKANLETREVLDSQALKPEIGEAAGRKRSQIARVEASPTPRSSEGRSTGGGSGAGGGPGRSQEPGSEMG